MDYNKIPLILKRYSFDEKMKVLQLYSKQIMKVTGIELISDKPMPWELETFLLFSVKSYEYQYKKFDQKNINEFIKIINCIKNYEHPKIKEEEGTIKFADLVLISHGSTQFDLQTYNVYKYYRYNYFFNYVSSNINMKHEFYKKFNIDYEKVFLFGSILSYMFSIKANLDSKIFEYIVKKYIDAVKILIISRDDFCKEIDKFSDNTDDYLYCVRPSNIYPFIEYQKTISLPLPHCLCRSITDSLLFRLTYNNNEIRTLIGKNVLEDYLFDIVNQSNLFDEVLKEKTYYKRKIEHKTPDVMCRKNDEYLFFESKSLVPYVKTRNLNEDIINKEIEKISDSIIQLYKQVYFNFKKNYNFFDDSKIEFNRDNCYGIVVLFEESYIRREMIYNSVATKLKVSKSDELFIWIISHIKVCNLYDIEKFVFTDTDILKSLKKQTADNKPFDYCLTNIKTNSKLSNENVYRFKKNIADNIRKMADELLKNGLL